MAHRLITLFAVSVLFTLVAAGSASAFEPASLDDLLKPILKRHKIPALAAAVVREGRTVASGAVGLREAGSKKHRVTLNDRFHLGSCTKSMTATLCAMLVEQGRLRWDSTVGEVFAALKDPIDPGFRKATLEQLLCHRAGLPEDRRPDLAVYPKLMMLTGEIMAQRREMVHIVMGRPPAHEVGTKYYYSNNGFSIAGAMCEAVTGESYESLMMRKLFEPLDMTTAGFGPPGRIDQVDQPRGHVKLLAWYSPQPPEPMADNPPVFSPAGRAHASIGDWAKYAALHLDGARGRPRLLKAESFARLHSDPYRQRYGFGWGMVKPEWSAGTVFAHDGSNTRWYAVIIVAPAEDSAIVIATNAASEPAQEACADARQALRERFLKK